MLLGENQNGTEWGGGGGGTVFGGWYWGIEWYLNKNGERVVVRYLVGHGIEGGGGAQYCFFY